MLLNILLLAILFIAGLFNLFFYFPTKKVYAWFSQSNSTSKPSIASNKGNKSKKNQSELRKVFATFDKNSDGFITKQELRDSLKNIRIIMSEKEVEEMINKLDSNGDGLIDFEEFGSLCDSMVAQKERVVINKDDDQVRDLDQDDDDDDDDQDDDLKEAFDVFDKDKDGLISFEELGSILSSLGLKEGKRVESCKEMIRKVDMDGDGMVNFQEFKRMMRSGGNFLLSS